MGQPQPKRLVVCSRLEEVAKVQQAVGCDVEAVGHAPGTQFAVRLALDEAMANAIHHGNSDDPNKHVTVEYSVTRQRIQISVTDEGNGFDPNAVPDPTLHENICKPNGRGLMLMHAYMTKVQYNSRGNSVTLVIQPNQQLLAEHAS